MKAERKSSGGTQPALPSGLSSYWQAAALLTLATVLGLAFNRSNPLGIRFTTFGGTPSASLDVGSKSVATASSPTLNPGTAQVLSPALTPPSIPAPGTVNTGEVLSVTTTTNAAPAVPTKNPIATTWEKTKLLIEAQKIQLVDARVSSAFEAGHIPGAVSLPQASTDDEIRAFRSKYGTNQHLVVYCSSTSCSLSYKLAYKLMNEFGYNNVEYMTGGYMEWQRAMGLSETPASTLPVVSSPVASSANSSAVVISPQAAPILPQNSEFHPTGIGWSEISKVYPSGNAQLVDIRPAAEFAAGHIEGAVALSDRATDAELGQFLKQVGQDRPLVLYCESAGCLDSIKFGARLKQFGFKNVRHLDEGYLDWRALNAKKSAKL